MKEKSMRSELYLPALRCVMGDRGYFIVSMRFDEVAQRIKDVTDVHKSEKLADWIQRQLIEGHAKDISIYLLNNEDRFFNALVVGVYGGNPEWAELSVGDPRNELLEEDEERLNRTIGFLTLSGKEELFPIDGQHRIAGIKRAVNDNPSLASEEVAVIFVGHAKTQIGMHRTRRLFVTLNKTAKKVSERDILALDEDNALAVVARRLIDDFNLFQQDGVISFSNTVNIPGTDKDAITSVLGLFRIVCALYPKKGKQWPKSKAIQSNRPSDAILDQIFDLNAKYWELLSDLIPQYNSVLVRKVNRSGDFRSTDSNHLLFRPAGQVAFAQAVEFLVSNGMSLNDAVSTLCSNNPMDLTNETWHNILWDPIGQVMLKEISAARTMLLVNANQKGVPKSAILRLERLQKSRR